MAYSRLRLANILYFRLTMRFPSVSLVIPCFNEANRIGRMFDGIREFAEKWHGDFEIILIDDGSHDGTDVLINKHPVFHALKANHQVILVQQANTGKGGALKLGVEKASKDFVLTLDADMATSPSHLIEWLAMKETLKQDEVLIGSRELKQSVIHEVPVRKWVGNVFNYIIRIIVGIPFHDTQCGFKLYPISLAKKVFSSLKTPGWSHDVELLLRVMQLGYKVIEMPVNWTAVEGSKINVLKDSWGMFWEVVKIRRDLGVRDKA